MEPVEENIDDNNILELKTSDREILLLLEQLHHANSALRKILQFTQTGKTDSIVGIEEPGNILEEPDQPNVTTENSDL